MEKEFHEIYERYSSDLYSFILKMCGYETLAKDILQDTMLRAMTNFDQYSGKCNIKTWLCTIAKNIYFDHLRRHETKNLPIDTAVNLSTHEYNDQSYNPPGMLVWVSNKETKYGISIFEKTLYIRFTLTRM